MQSKAKRHTGDMGPFRYLSKTWRPSTPSCESLGRVRRAALNAGAVGGGEGTGVRGGRRRRGRRDGRGRARLAFLIDRSPTSRVVLVAPFRLAVGSQTSPSRALRPAAQVSRRALDGLTSSRLTTVPSRAGTLNDRPLVGLRPGSAGTGRRCCPPAMSSPPSSRGGPAQELPSPALPRPPPPPPLGLRPADHSAYLRALAIGLAADDDHDDAEWGGGGVIWDVGCGCEASLPCPDGHVGELSVCASPPPRSPRGVALEPPTPFNPSMLTARCPCLLNRLAVSPPPPTPPPASRSRSTRARSSGRPALSSRWDRHRGSSAGGYVSIFAVGRGVRSS